MRPSLRSAWVVARVACPQRSLSTAGVNQRSAQSPSAIGRANAVSEACTSAATCRIHVSSGQAAPSSRQTPAGLPANGRSVNASMIRMRMASTLRANRRPAQRQSGPPGLSAPSAWHARGMNIAPLIARYAQRFHRAVDGYQHVASPLGAWLVLALAAPAATGAAREQLAEILG